MLIEYKGIFSPIFNTNLVKRSTFILCYFSIIQNLDVMKKILKLWLESFTPSKIKASISSRTPVLQSAHNKTPSITLNSRGCVVNWKGSHSPTYWIFTKIAIFIFSNYSKKVLKFFLKWFQQVFDQKFFFSSFIMHKKKN